MPKRWVGQVSFLAIVAGDQSCDFVGKLWAYGFTIDGHHYGPEEPAQWHRGWPGLGVTHSLLWAFVAAGLVYLVSRSRPWTIGVLLGAALHALSDVGDSVGTMLAFPFSTENFSIGAWAYAATADGGKYLDAAAYYSSWGFVMDALWFVLALTGWRCLTHAYWKQSIVGADPKPWAWLGRWLPERALVTLYRAWFIYATTQAHRLDGCGPTCSRTSSGTCAGAGRTGSRRPCSRTRSRSRPLWRCSAEQRSCSWWSTAWSGRRPERGGSTLPPRPDLGVRRPWPPASDGRPRPPRPSR